MKVVIKKLEKNRDKIHAIHEQLSKETDKNKIKRLEKKYAKLVDCNVELIAGKA